MMLAACDSDEKVETMTINLTTKSVVAETRSAAQDLQLTQFASGQSVGIFLVENVSGTPTLTGSNVTSYAQPLSYTADGSGNQSNVSGSAQNLVNAGSVTHGTIYYSTNGGSNWSTSLPQGTNAGTYTVHYKVVPYTGYSGGVGSTSLGSTTIAKANGWVTLSSYSSTGWNTAKRKEVTITATHHGGTLTGSSPTQFLSVSVSGNNVTITKLRLVSADPPRNITITSAETANYKAASATYTCNQ